jgi:protocatechuate 3,4-dioxygenase, beta subunit
MVASKPPDFGKISRYQPSDAAAHPPARAPHYASTLYRSPSRPFVAIPQTLSELTGPLYGHTTVEASDADLTTNAGTGHPALGERLIVWGRVIEEDGRPIPNTLVEVWQCNAAGRYPHVNDTHPAPLDPHFLGAGRALTDEHGVYRFTTIRPGAYPWRNNYNAWRPAHIHFSLFGPCLLTRLVTQMYFPGDPLLPLDSIYMSVPTEAARERLIARYDHETTAPNWALAYRFDIVLRGRESTPMESL